MRYIFDTNSFAELSSYFPGVFPSFWLKFNACVAAGRTVSVKEVLREMERGVRAPHLRQWMADHSSIFLPPGPGEGEFVAVILANPTFRALVKQKNVLAGRPDADPFIIAAAKVKGACVVTEETKKENAAKIPTACEFYGVNCTNLEGFMADEGWVF